MEYLELRCPGMQSSDIDFYSRKSATPFKETRDPSPAQPITHGYTMVTLTIASLMKMMYTQESILKTKINFGKKPLFVKETWLSGNLPPPT